MRVGEPLREFQGVLTGVPSYTGGTSPLMGMSGAIQPVVESAPVTDE
jgi:hypothetical protein